MLKKIPVMIFILSSLVLLAGCKEEPKQQAKQESQAVQIQPTPEQIEKHKKMTEGEFKPSEKKAWKPF